MLQCILCLINYSGIHKDFHWRCECNPDFKKVSGHGERYVQDREGTLLTELLPSSLSFCPHGPQTAQCPTLSRCPAYAAPRGLPGSGKNTNKINKCVELKWHNSVLSDVIGPAAVRGTCSEVCGQSAHPSAPSCQTHHRNRRYDKRGRR